MERIIEIHLNHLSKSLHIFAMEFVLAALKRFPIVAQDFPEAQKALERTFEREQEAFRRHVPHDLVDKQKEYGTERDRAFQCINWTLKGAMLNSDERLAEAAKTLYGFIKDAGGANITNKSITVKTALYNGIVERMRTDFQKEVALLDGSKNYDISAELNRLKEMNAIFAGVRSGLVADKSEHIRRELSRARLMTDRAYRALIDSVNIRVYLDQTDVYNPFIDYMNIELSELRSQLKRKGGTIEVDEESEELLKYSFNCCDETEQS